VIAFLIMQAVASTPVSAESRSLYEPYRQCLLSQAGKVLLDGKADEVIITEARSACMAANLHSGSKVLFSELRATGSQETAISNIAALRAEVEAEALTAMRAKASALEKR
jgi:hypothetical protein